MYVGTYVRTYVRRYVCMYECTACHSSHSVFGCCVVQVKKVMYARTYVCIDRQTDRDRQAGRHIDIIMSKEKAPNLFRAIRSVKYLHRGTLTLGGGRGPDKEPIGFKEA